jgi:integrase
MPTMFNRLSAKFIGNITREGRYADGGCLYLEVGPGGKAKSFVFSYSRKRWGGKTGNIGLGSAHAGHTTLAEAREKADQYRKQIRDGFDPKEQKEKERRERWRAKARNTTLKAMIDEYIEARANDVVKPWQRSTRVGVEHRLNHYAKPLHGWPVAEISAGQVFDIINPIRQAGKLSTAHLVRTNILSVIDWAIGRQIFPADKVNPASMTALHHLLNTTSTTPVATPLGALHFSEMHALFTKLQSFQRRTWYTPSEAARAVGRDRSTIHRACEEGELIATKPEHPTIPGGSWQCWQIEPANLFQKWRKQVEEVLPGLPPVSIYLIQFSILCANRPSEARNMRWSERDESEQMWTVPWERMKKGRETRLDHHIPLNDEAIEILDILRSEQRRSGRESDFVFSQYLTPSPTSTRIGFPPNPRTVRNMLYDMIGRDLDEERAAGAPRGPTAHGTFRTAFGSWARHHGYNEPDIERALSHIKGYGSVYVARLYSRDATRDVPLRRLFADWGRYCTTGKLPANALPSAEIVPLRQAGQRN